MKIVMMTNTYLPHVSGVANSVARFTKTYRDHGHDVLVVAPKFDGAVLGEQGVVRVPAIQRFNGSDFSVMLPVPLYLTRTLNRFKPDIIHAHQPFLLGDTAWRAAASRSLPLVFTYHTMYEQYTHYVPFGAQKLQEFIIELSTGYANRCDRVIVPSRSVGAILRRRGVSSPIVEIPTGVDPAEFHDGDPRILRQELGIPEDAPVAGYVGRLAPEKNLDFLALAVVTLLKSLQKAHFIVAGAGLSRENMEAVFAAAALDRRVHFVGNLAQQRLVNAYHAMDLFLFASQSETQGMVLVEAMASGVPVLALDGPGVREVVRSGRNGLLLEPLGPAEFATAAETLLTMPKRSLERIKRGALRTAAKFTTEKCAGKALAIYEAAIENFRARPGTPATEWESLRALIEQEWNLWANRFAAASTLIATGAKEEEI